jgi:hypothetical protein
VFLNPTTCLRGEVFGAVLIAAQKHRSTLTSSAGADQFVGTCVWFTNGALPGQAGVEANERLASALERPSHGRSSSRDDDFRLRVFGKQL